ncbi:MAG: substrate-binding domain-containing protein [Acidimicrobiales bacterium]
MRHAPAMRWRVVAASAAAALVAAACGSTSSSSTTPSSGSGGPTRAKPVTVGLALKPLDNPYFATMDQGARSEAKKLGIHLTVAAAANLSSATGQANALSALISHGYSCYLANPVDATNLVQPLIQAQSQHKPIVNIDLPISPAAATAAGVHLATYIGTNNVSAGKLAAVQLAKMVPPGSQVAIIGGPASDPTSQARIKGFTEGASGKLQIIQTAAANWVRATALNDATSIMETHPKLRGFFVANGDMALGVQRAIGAAGKQGKVDTIGVIGDTAVLHEIADGTMAAAVEQFPYTIGSMGVQACVAAARGKRLPSTVATPVQVVTKANASQALASFPKPFKSFTDPFTALLGS